ncbi:hypothetical protein PHET_07757 [Paragonimus heterotremus]|uniref:Phosphatidylinositol-4,5-bisphosphate 4-phosphatase n=1 Tax=Paragonimus heterotremus TaxID=100268 RepID=A0A8J4WFX7_9TREM|nr:hypothetical protein PHET_07757 [Paragonimus heterotremus]
MDEKTPLISAGESRVEPVHSGNVVAHAETNYIDNQATINCHVCNHVVSIENREKQLVVRCPNCSEATPIKGPPAGKQYVRCPCNCLLVCSTKTTRVGCPRPECQKVIVLHEVSQCPGMLVHFLFRVAPRYLQLVLSWKRETKVLGNVLTDRGGILSTRLL